MLRQAILLLLFLPLVEARAEVRDSLSLLRLISYNVENLFDTEDDPETRDEEFTPEGRKQWTSARYRRKLDQIAQTIARASQEYWPGLICLVEVEGERCLDDLLAFTALGRQGYSYTITHSADARGIDVALLYREPLLRLLERSEHEIPLPRGEAPTRNILRVSFALSSGPILHVFAMHWPSRRGGRRATASRRRAAALRTRELCDSLHQAWKGQEQHFVLMGDLNATAREVELREVLGSSLEPPLMLKDSLSTTGPRLYNLLSQAPEAGPRGTHFFSGVWYLFDQIIISESLLSPSSCLRYREGSARIYAGPELLAPDRLGRLRPRATYAGDHYLGGYSDHLPVLADLWLRPREKP